SSICPTGADRGRTSRRWPRSAAPGAGWDRTAAATSTCTTTPTTRSTRSIRPTWRRTPPPMPCSPSSRRKPTAVSAAHPRRRARRTSKLARSRPPAGPWPLDSGSTMPQRKRRVGASVTILDVARHAGVSPMTASRVINQQPNVGQAMRERVLASVEALGYRPNLAGRSLRTSGTARIGVLYSNPSAAYLNQFMLGVVEKCGGLRSQRAAVQRLRDAAVDGIILPPPLCDSRRMLQELEDAGIPVVAVAGGAPTGAAASVRIDDYAGARAMVRHLLDLGH